jgi:hypothetical protein
VPQGLLEFFPHSQALITPSMSAWHFVDGLAHLCLSCSRTPQTRRQQTTGEGGVSKELKVAEPDEEKHEEDQEAQSNTEVNSETSEAEPEKSKNRAEP